MTAVSLFLTFGNTYIQRHSLVYELFRTSFCVCVCVNGFIHIIFVIIHWIGEKPLRTSLMAFKFHRPLAY